MPPQKAVKAVDASASSPNTLTFPKTFPLELTSEILKKLSYWDLLRVLRACKPWKMIIETDPELRWRTFKAPSDTFIDDLDTATVSSSWETSLAALKASGNFDFDDLKEEGYVLKEEGYVRLEQEDLEAPSTGFLRGLYKNPYKSDESKPPQKVSGEIDFDGSENDSEHGSENDSENDGSEEGSHGGDSSAKAKVESDLFLLHPIFPLISFRIEPGGLNAAYIMRDNDQEDVNLTDCAALHDFASIPAVHEVSLSIEANYFGDDPSPVQDVHGGIVNFTVDIRNSQGVTVHDIFSALENISAHRMDILGRTIFYEGLEQPVLRGRHLKAWLGLGS
ncbi:hypothetical protein GGX14DRAFT_410508 [Mycena pura]|uniref:F-box domain-containing protein n=1 Tax=Mycena pura TaxID=153505 RepID=A0AAD6YV44_9AGAR|nr:hypothetical protein GGX14DRAFT_410508 [Mycena pura]